MIRMVRHGKEKEEETYEPVQWPPRRRSEPAPAPQREPEREPRREPARRKREKAPA